MLEGRRVLLPPLGPADDALSKMPPYDKPGALDFEIALVAS